MKKTISFLTIFFACSAFFFTSCKKDAALNDVQAPSAITQSAVSSARSADNSFTATVEISKAFFQASLENAIIIYEPLPDAGEGGPGYKAISQIDMQEWHGGVSSTPPTPGEHCQAARAAFSLWVAANAQQWQRQADNSGLPVTQSNHYFPCPDFFSVTFYPAHPGVCPECSVYQSIQTLHVVEATL